MPQLVAFNIRFIDLKVPIQNPVTIGEQMMNVSKNFNYKINKLAKPMWFKFENEINK